MARLFDFNNLVWRFMGKVADMFFLVGAGGIAYAHSVILENIIFPKYKWNEK